VADFDVFNGDADGICALHQLRLAEPRDAELVTGVKRDIGLLDRVTGRAATGDRVTVLDVSAETNAGALAEILAAGARVQWFDHHFPGRLPDHPQLDASIDLSPTVSTSLLVDRYLGGRCRPWAIVAAFGDGLPEVAAPLAEAAGYDSDQRRRLAALGEAINYNAYGDEVADLFVPPADLYRRLSGFADPLAFVAADPVAGELVDLMARDTQAALACLPELDDAHCIAFRLPDAAWARRISGHFANLVSARHPRRAVAVLTPRRSGSLVVSVRAPRDHPVGADQFCRQFPTGGGRSGAGGINMLDPDDSERFLAAFCRHFSGEPAARA
jgi:hypothetical protein